MHLHMNLHTHILLAVLLIQRLAHVSFWAVLAREASEIFLIHSFQLQSLMWCLWAKLPQPSQRCESWCFCVAVNLFLWWVAAASPCGIECFFSSSPFVWLSRISHFSRSSSPPPPLSTHFQCYQPIWMGVSVVITTILKAKTHHLWTAGIKNSCHYCFLCTPPTLALARCAPVLVDVPLNSSRNCPISSLAATENTNFFFHSLPAR